MEINENGLVYCKTCEISIMPERWVQHINGKKHKAAGGTTERQEIHDKLWERWHNGAIMHHNGVRK